MSACSHPKVLKSERLKLFLSLLNFLFIIREAIRSAILAIKQGRLLQGNCSVARGTAYGDKVYATVCLNLLLVIIFAPNFLTSIEKELPAGSSSIAEGMQRHNH